MRIIYFPGKAVVSDNSINKPTTIHLNVNNQQSVASIDNHIMFWIRPLLPLEGSSPLGLTVV